MFGASANSATDTDSSFERNRQIAGIVGFDRAEFLRRKNDVDLFRQTSDMLSCASSEGSDGPVLFTGDSQHSAKLLGSCRLHNNAWNYAVNRILLQASLF